MGDGCRKFKAEAEIIRGLIPPALDNLCPGKGIQRGVALHAVNMSGVIN